MQADLPASSSDEFGTEPRQQSFSKLPIHPRRVKFDFDDIDGPFYYQGNRCISAAWVALSASFPAGEGEFIKSVRLFEDKITDPKLQQEVKDFVHQEAHHSLQHKQVNKMFDQRGYNTAGLLGFFEEELKKREEQWSPEKRLARTVCAEHVTATMAHHALTHPEHMSCFPESFRNLFLWHAIEEIEHKSVAFDVYKECVDDQKLLRYQYKIFTRFEFPFNLFMISRFLLRELGQKARWQDIKGLRKHLFGQGGLIDKDMRALYREFLQDGFHPWDQDDSALVEEWKTKLSPYFVEQ